LEKAVKRKSRSTSLARVNTILVYHSKRKTVRSETGHYDRRQPSRLAMPRKKKAVHADAPSFGQRLAELRKRAGFTQKEFGEQLDVSQRVVAYYEGQTDYPPTQLLPRIAEVLGISADELLGMRAPKASVKPANQRLLRRLKEIEQLPLAERRQLIGLIDTYLEKNRLAKSA
jgi:transcriptional regulator with XRE-family HTH domain